LQYVSLVKKTYVKGIYDITPLRDILPLDYPLREDLNIGTNPYS